MKNLWTLMLTVVLLTACGGSSDNTPADDVRAENTESETTGLCNDSVGGISLCADEYKGLAVREWFKFLDFNMNFSLGDPFPAPEKEKSFRCGEIMGFKARTFFSSTAYQFIVKPQMFEIYKLFINPKNCKPKPNLERLFREELNKQ